MRIYDPRLGKFLSTDPIAREYPELTPYQYASNTPIQAIDLDGLEAVKVDLAARATFIFVTGAVSIGVVAAPDGIAFFVSPEIGVGAGVSVGAGVGVSYYPNVTKASELGGWGVNTGGSFMGNGGDFSASIQQDEKGTPTDTKLGGAIGVPRLGGGAGAEAHLSGSYSFQAGETMSWKDIYKGLSLVAKGLGVDESDLLNAVNKAKEEQLKLTDQNKNVPTVTMPNNATKKEEIETKPKSKSNSSSNKSNTNKKDDLKGKEKTKIKG